jgi:hypothetical protein
MAYFTTNLDLAQPYVRELSKKWQSAHLPRKGEKVVFSLSGRRGFMLEVVDVRYTEEGIPTVELHMGNATPCRTIMEWKEWFKRLTRGGE